jgi:hypothetical protein
MEEILFAHGMPLAKMHSSFVGWWQCDTQGFVLLANDEFSQQWLTVMRLLARINFIEELFIGTILLLIL